MALDDILNAITQETDARIVDAKTAHKQRLSAMREESEKRLLAKKVEMNKQRKEKEDAMRSKANIHMSLNRRNTLLAKKRESLDLCYERVLEKLATKKPAELEKLLTSCINTIKSKGTIHPTAVHADLIKKIANTDQFTIGKTIDAKGGFTFVSDQREYDFTLESIVNDQLRPQTELHVSKQLFGTAA